MNTFSLKARETHLCDNIHLPVVLFDESKATMRSVLPKKFKGLQKAKTAKTRMTLRVAFEPRYLGIITNVDFHSNTVMTMYTQCQVLSTYERVKMVYELHFFSCPQASIHCTHQRK